MFLVTQADPAQHWAAVVAIILGIVALLGGAWRIFRLVDRVSEKLGTPNGKGDVITMLTSAVGVAEEAKRLTAETADAAKRLAEHTAGWQEEHARSDIAHFASQDLVLARQDEILERLQRGQDATHELIAGLTNAQAQTAAAVAQLEKRPARRKPAAPLGG